MNRAVWALPLAVGTVICAVACGAPETVDSRVPTPGPTEEPAPSGAVTNPVAAQSERPVERRRVSGEIFYRDRIRLPSDARMTVRILRNGGADSVVIAETTTRPKLQVPIPFEIEVLAAEIQPGVTYRLDVAISRRGETVFALPEPVTIFGEGSHASDLRLLLRKVM